MELKFNGRKVHVEISLAHGVGMVDSAYYLDTDSDLTENELNQLESEHAMAIDEEAHQIMVMKAEAAFEGDR
jgi:S-adenosylmethionine:diacylglycerol 3-amino-3-carboxypropyl transferase